MGNNQSYVERKEDEQDLYGSGFPFGDKNNALPMIEMTRTNQLVISDEQGILLNIVDMEIDTILAVTHDDDLKKLLKAVSRKNHENVRTVQLTRDGYSRGHYITVAIAGRRKQTLFDRILGRPGQIISGDDSGGDSD